MNITVRSPEGIRFCEGCKTEHLGLRCEPGTKYRDRLRGVQLDNSVTPSRALKDYADDEGLKDIFGLDRNERREQMADATEGRGYTTVDDIPYAD